MSGRTAPVGRRTALARLADPPDPGRGRSASGVLDPLGRRLRRLARRPSDPAADRAAGRAVAAAAVVTVLHPAAGVVVAAAWAGVAWQRRRRSAAHRAAELVASLPDAVDLLALAVGTGASPRLAVEAVARHGRGPLAEAFGEVLADVDRRGDRLADRLARLTGEMDPVVALVVHPLVAAERYGTPLLPALALVGSDLRQLRRHRAEEAIRRVPVKLVFPLVGCTLPALALLTLVPVLAASFRHLDP